MTTGEEDTPRDWSLQSCKMQGICFLFLLSPSPFFSSPSQQDQSFHHVSYKRDPLSLSAGVTTGRKPPGISPPFYTSHPPPQSKRKGVRAGCDHSSTHSPPLLKVLCWTAPVHRGRVGFMYEGKYLNFGRNLLLGRPTKWLTPMASDSELFCNPTDRHDSESSTSPRVKQ